MKVILDTNMVYYISGVSTHPGMDKIRIINELSKYEKVYVSKFSVLEICTYLNTDLLTIEKIFLELAKLGCSIIRENTIDDNGFNTILKDEQSLKKTVEDSLEKMIEAESRVLYFLSTSIAISYLCLTHDIDFNNHKNQITHCNDLEKIILNVSIVELMTIFRDFYANCLGTKLNDKIVDYILDLCTYFVKSYHVNDLGMTMCDFTKNIGSISDEKKQEFIKNISNDESLIRIEKRRVQERLLDKKFSQKLDAYLEYISKKLSHIFGNYAGIKYYTILFKKFFELEGMKIKKNDIIDSLLLAHYPEYLILTADKKFINYIEEISKNDGKNKNYADQIKTFLKNVGQ